MKILENYIRLVINTPGGYVLVLHQHCCKLGKGPLVTEKKTVSHTRILRMTFVKEELFNQLYKDTADAKRFGPLGKDDKEDGTFIAG